MAVKTTSFKDNVYKIVAGIRPGQVLSYSEVATRAGSARAARAVGNLMNKNPYPKDKVPCHRVVRSDGAIGGYARGPAKKISLLKSEGVMIANGRVDLRRY